MIVRAPQRRYRIHVIPAKAGTQSLPSRKAIMWPDPYGNGCWGDTDRT